MDARRLSTAIPEAPNAQSRSGLYTLGRLCRHNVRITHVFGALG